MRHQQHFNASLESLYSIEALTEQYEQGLRDADTVISFEAQLEQGDESCTEQLYALGVQYGTESVSQEGHVTKLQALVAWAKDVLKKIWAFIKETFSKLMQVTMVRIAYLQTRNAKLKKVLISSTADLQAEIASELMDAVLEKHRASYDAAATRFSNETTHLMSWLQDDHTADEVRGKLQSHWSAFSALYHNKTDVASELGGIDKPSEMLKKYRQLLTDRAGQSISLDHIAARGGRALVTKMEIEELAKGIDQTLDAIKARQSKLHDSFDSISKRVNGLVDQAAKLAGNKDPSEAEERVRTLTESQKVGRSCLGAALKVEQKTTSTIGDLLGGIDGLGVLF